MTYCIQYFTSPVTRGITDVMTLHTHANHQTATPVVPVSALPMRAAKSLINAKGIPGPLTLRWLMSFLLVLPVLFGYSQCPASNKEIVAYCVNPKKQQLQFFNRDDNGKAFKSFSRLNDWLNSRGKKLAFATNGGMYQHDNSPVGLYVENGKTKKKLSHAKGGGNFGWKPNGVFYITTDNKAQIVTTEQFAMKANIKYATQSGPMLLINGKMHAGFAKNSKHANTRNGVGILPDGRILFAMSKNDITFYAFAQYFQDAGCKNALYFDGAVSRTYLPAQKQMDDGGDFGVIIAEVVSKK